MRILPDGQVLLDTHEEMVLSHLDRMCNDVVEEARIPFPAYQAYLLSKLGGLAVFNRVTKRQFLEAAGHAFDRSKRTLARIRRESAAAKKSAQRVRN